MRSAQILRDEFQIPMTQTMDREVSNMCNLSQAVWEEATAEGMKHGMEQGMKQGMEQGMKQGWANAQLASARKMKEKGYAADEIAEITGIPLAEINGI